MKKILISTILLGLFNASSFAIDFVKGKNVKEDVSPRMLRTYLRKGMGSIGAHRIVISEDAKIPAKFQKKWNELKLTGESVPSVGKKTDDVIFIQSF